MIPSISLYRMTGAADRAQRPVLVLGPSLGTSATTLWGDCALGPGWGLAERFDVLAWDLPGHGYSSSVPAEQFSAEELAAGVLRVVDDVLEQRGEPGGTFAYAGDSIGGAVGLQLLLDAPDRVSAAAIVCSAARFGDPQQWLDRIETLHAGGTDGLVEGSLQRWFAPGFVERRPEVADRLVGALRAVSDRGYEQACRVLAAFDVRSRLSEITAPVLVVAGAHDTPAPPSYGAEIADGVADGRLVVLDDVAHLAPAEAPERVAALIREHVLGESPAVPTTRPSARPRSPMSSDRQSAYVYAAARTPFGRFGGALAGVRPDDLAAVALAGVLDNAPGLGTAESRAAIDDVWWGLANGAGEDNRNVGRMAVLLAGLPVSVPAATVNRLCGSSLEALAQASRAIEVGDAEITVAGGVESMTRAPWVLPKPGRAFPAGNVEAVSTTLGWRLVNERMPAEWTASLGECNEQVADELGISRARQDEFAVRSHRLAAAAWDAGFYDDLVVPVPDVDLTRDEGIRPDSSLEALVGLRPAFRKDGTITPGNASPLNDGASALLVGSAGAADALGLEPMARVAGRGVHANTPERFGIAPVEAAEMALARAGIGWADIAAVELNEAFAVQSIGCVDAWLARGLADPELVNAKGGAIAVGHPLGASGSRIVATLAARLGESGERWGLAAICIGVGQALAVVLENPDAPGAG